MGNENIARLPLKVGSLDTIGQKGKSYKPEDQAFFEPLSEEALGRFPIAGTDPDRLEGYECAFTRIKGESLLGAADGIWLSLAWQANNAVRDGIPEVDGTKKSLGVYRGWRFQE